MRNRIEELIWESQDGEIIPVDREWLATRLARDSAARRAAEAASGLAATLEQAAGEVLPPPELRLRIRTALASARREPRRSSILESVRSLLLPPSAPRLAYLAAGLIGLVLGGAGAYLIQATRQLGPIPVQELYGTMRPRATGGVDFELAGGAGTLTLRRQGAVLEIEAELAANLVAEPADAIQIRGQALRARRFAAQPGGAARLEASEQDVVVRGLGPGRHLLVLELADSAEAIEISVSSRGRPLLSRELRLADL